MSRLVRTLAAIALTASVIPSAYGETAEFASECEWAPDAPSALVVGVVGCLRIDADASLGAPAPFSYFIPPACAPPEGDCPVLYVLHGAPGSYTSSLGLAGSPGSAWVAALSSRPSVDPDTVADPWSYGDTSEWVEAEPLDVILIAPQGQTIPGGYGPDGVDTGFADYNPRYAETTASNPDEARYPGPPPRMETYLVDQLIPYVDAHFPSIADRSGRAIVGVSHGGLGSFHTAFTHPDLFASAGSVSAGFLPFPTAPEAGVQSPVDAPATPLPYTTAPGVTPVVVPTELYTVTFGAEASVGWGDPVADQYWWRYVSPAEQAGNVSARGAGRQSMHLVYSAADGVPRRAEDVTEPNPGSWVEAALLATNLDLEQVLERQGIERSFTIRQGLHGGPYRSVFLRKQLEAQYAHIRHQDGTGDPAPDPDAFDYRTIRKDFTIWGWRVEVDRQAMEFIDLFDVSCTGLTLRGTGVVTVTVPPRCGSGHDGATTFEVDLGPAHPNDEPLGLGATDAYGHTVAVALEPLSA